MTRKKKPEPNVSPDLVRDVIREIIEERVLKRIDAMIDAEFRAIVEHAVHGAASQEMTELHAKTLAQRRVHDLVWEAVQKQIHDKIRVRIDFEATP